MAGKNTPNPWQIPITRTWDKEAHKQTTLDQRLSFSRRLSGPQVNLITLACEKCHVMNLQAQSFFAFWLREEWGESEKVECCSRATRMRKAHRSQGTTLINENKRITTVSNLLVKLNWYLAHEKYYFLLVFFGTLVTTYSSSSNEKFVWKNPLSSFLNFFVENERVHQLTCKRIKTYNLLLLP